MMARDEFPTPVKKAYVAPVLVRYGDVRLLTQSGSGTSSENSATSGPPGCTTQLTKKPCAASDPRMKHRVTRVGEHPAGFGLYLFHYREPFALEHGRGRQFGVMADEVRRIVPEAVHRQPNGFDFVDYEMLGIRLAS